jgi:hypothetical protein
MSEPTEAQYLVINALDTLGLLIENRYDEESGFWYLYTLSPILPLSVLMPDGEITAIEPGARA